MANELVAFKGSNLAKVDLNTLQEGFNRAQEAIQVSGGVQYLKMLKQDGEWVYGQQDTDVEPGSEWAVNPESFMVGYIAWDDKGNLKGKEMRSVFKPVIRLDELNNVGAQWQEQCSFQMQCISGEDAGLVVEYGQSSRGGKDAFQEMVRDIRIQLSKGSTDIVPIVELKSDHYMHKTRGKIFVPIFEIKRWVGMSGEAAAEEQDEAPQQAMQQAQPASTPAQQQAVEANPEPPRTRRFNRGAVSDAQPAAPPAQAAVAEPEKGTVVRRTRRRN